MSLSLFIKPLDHRALWVVLLSVFVGQAFFLYPKLGEADGVINGDGRGYYDYLTSVFIDHDLAQQEVNDRYILEVDGRGVNKYFIGTGILMLPFFLLGWLIAALSSVPIDGLSWPFQWSMTLSALFYWALGLHFLRCLLRSYNIDSKTIAFSLIALTIGTNAFYYLTVDCTASHTYSFAAVAGFLLLTRRWYQSGFARHLVFAAILFGLIISIRPVNGLVILFVPGLFNGWKSLRSSLSNHRRSLLIALTSVLIFPAFQLAAYKWQTGHWLIWSYANEGFYFLNPAWWKFLFSFERGWLVYTPLFLLVIPGFITLFKSNNWRATIWFLWFGITVYILSAWWSWHYGGSFGSRPMIDFYACFTLLILLSAKKWKISLAMKRAGILTVILLIALNLSQVYQLEKGIISAWHMNAGKYWWSLGSYSANDANLLGGRFDTPPFHTADVLVYEGDADPSKKQVHWRFNETKGDAVLFDANTEFNGTFSYTFQQRLNAFIGIELSLERLEHTEDAASKAYVVVDVKNDNGKRKHYDAFFINDFPGSHLEEWKQWQYRYVVPHKVEEGDQVRVYLWNKGLESFEVRNMNLKIRAFSD